MNAELSEVLRAIDAEAEIEAFENMPLEAPVYVTYEELEAKARRIMEGAEHEDDSARTLTINRRFNVHGLSGIDELLDFCGYVPRLPIDELAANADDSTHDGPAAAKFLLENRHAWTTAFTGKDLHVIYVVPAVGHEMHLAVALANFKPATLHDGGFGDGDGNEYIFLRAFWWN